MNHQTNHHKNIDPSKAINLTTAKLWVSQWLKTISRMPGFEDKKKHEQIPRAIFISMDDIDQLRTAYPDAVGIRMYFGIAGEDQPLGQNIQDLRGLIVPVISEPKTGAPVDLISSNPHDTSVYDFTAPCPAYCDKASELYLPVSS